MSRTCLDWLLESSDLLLGLWEVVTKRNGDEGSVVALGSGDEGSVVTLGSGDEGSVVTLGSGD